MTQEEILDRIEKVAIVNQYSQILDQLVCEEIDLIREELKAEADQHAC